MNDEKTEQTEQPSQPAETERLEREEKRKEREAECAAINAVVADINKVVDRLNELASARIELSHEYRTACLAFELDRTQLRCDACLLHSDFLRASDRESFDLSRQWAVLNEKLDVLNNAYTEKWEPTWGGLVHGVGSILSSLMGSYYRSAKEITDIAKEVKSP